MYRFTALLVMVGLFTGQLLDRHCPADSESEPSRQHAAGMTHQSHSGDEMPRPTGDHHQEAPCELAMGCSLVATIPNALMRSVDVPNTAVVVSHLPKRYSPPSLAADPPPPRLLV